MTRPVLLFTVLSTTCILGCNPTRPARKELPPILSSLPEIESTVTPYPSRWSLNSQRASDYLFYSTDTSLLIDGMRHDFLVLAIPSPSRDSTIGALITSGESLAPYLLTQLRSLNKTGVVIDLRVADNTPTIRTDYLVSSSELKVTNLPVIFLWDQASAGRATFFTQYLEQFPNASWSITKGGRAYQADCFKAEHPSF